MPLPITGEANRTCMLHRQRRLAVSPILVQMMPPRDTTGPEISARGRAPSARISAPRIRLPKMTSRDLVLMVRHYSRPF
jgi:hypothetical protein